MEECKRMGLKVLGPDINESLKGFAVNAKGEIRFGLGGLKGVGEAAVESIIEERKKNGAYTDIFDFIKRVNQRTVNKKSIESLANSGAFDCFKDVHRAQYFYASTNDNITGIERIIRFGNTFHANKQTQTNTLFGDTVLPAIASPLLPKCTEWTLTEKLEREKEVTGMFMSGHPLDHFKFELRYYGITKLTDFTEIKESNTLAAANREKSMRIAGLVTDAQHRVSRNGKNFGSMMIEDFSGKAELMLWSDDYVKFKNYLEKGNNLLIYGYFKQRFNGDEYEFKVTAINLLETAKMNLTRNLEICIESASVTNEFVTFISNNVRANPGKSSLRFKIKEPQENLEVVLSTTEKGFTMNEEMAAFLLDNPDVEVSVGLFN
jgi:DNA polymerase-3 subunit alpha